MEKKYYSLKEAATLLERTEDKIIAVIENNELEAAYPLDIPRKAIDGKTGLACDIPKGTYGIGVFPCNEQADVKNNQGERSREEITRRILSFSDDTIFVNELSVYERCDGVKLENGDVVSVSTWDVMRSYILIGDPLEIPKSRLVIPFWSLEKYSIDKMGEPLAVASVSVPGSGSNKEEPLPTIIMPEDIVWRERAKGKEPWEIARIIDIEFHGNLRLSPERLGELLPANPGTNIARGSEKKRGQRLRQAYKEKFGTD